MRKFLSHWTVILIMAGQMFSVPVHSQTEMAEYYVVAGQLRVELHPWYGPKALENLP